MECMRDLFRKDQLLDGRFRTIAPLNHGSFGMVFLAEDTKTQQEVAVKCLSRRETSDCSLIHTLPDEGNEELACHATLKHHDHLVNLVHHFETPAHLYLVLEYCAQGDLYEAIRHERGPLQTEHVRRFMLQLMGAVEHMHARGLYHRDIKPENIFITSDGDMKLGDFGLATRQTWCYESCVGSDRYMAPEQYDPANIGYSPAQADIWSIGICLLNVLFARNPFVTPTDSDILFADYRRDRQSLFDIFTNMSQDTFEILSIAMALDPTKRDLKAVRQAILRAVTFTTEDDQLDDFCVEERDVVRASANREPLRTPSILSPQLENESFPWTRALAATTPQAKQRQLSVIPDLYEEDLFESEKNTKLGQSWYSGHANTPSMASGLDSAYGSLKSIAIQQPAYRSPPRPELAPIPHSLPIRASRNVPTMSSVFSKKDSMAKSWSEMFEEDEEEALQEMQAQHSPNWSHESRKNTPVPKGVLTESKSRSSSNVRLGKRNSKDGSKPSSPVKAVFTDAENDPLGWRNKTPVPTPRRSPKLISADKWAALGNKRRNISNENESQTFVNKPRSMTVGSRKRTPSGPENYAWHRRDSRNKQRPAHLDQDWRQTKVVDSSTDQDDHEWVGGWHNFHL